MSDPAAGKFELPGGHIEGTEPPRAAAMREWQEETGLPFVDGEWTGTWTSANGIYQGFVYTIAREADLDIFDRQLASDPDGDVNGTEAIAWWDPADLPGNPAVRAELLADIDAVMAALGCTEGAAGVAKAGGSSAAPKAPTLDVKNLTGVWAEVYDRREKLLRRHLRAVAAAWDACLADLDTGELVREFRAKAGTVAKLADPHAKWWKDTGTAAALAWLLRLSGTKGYPALVAALEDAIRSGMAEGEADALALAADRQGVAGFQVEKAFRAAYDRLAGDAEVARQAQDAASGMIDGAAADAGRALADQAGDDGSEDDMASAVDDALSGDGSQPVGLGVDWQLFAAILAGALALYSRAASESEAEGEPEHEEPEGEEPGAGDEEGIPEAPGGPGGGGTPAGQILLNWITAGDNRVCPTCSGYEDNSPYTPGSVPEYPHPRCRCSVDLAPESGSSLLGALLDAFAN